MENIVLQIGAALDKVLGLLPVQIMTLACAALFTLLHWASPEWDMYPALPLAAYYVLFALLSTLVCVRDRGFELSWAAHSANNIFVALSIIGGLALIILDSCHVDSVMGYIPADSDLWLALGFGTAAVQQNIHHKAGTFPFFSAVAEIQNFARLVEPVFKPVVYS